jgi:hypothetical protein
MDGRIGRLVCTATVVAGARDGQRSVALAEGVLRTELPAALPAALDRVLADDPAVYVARSLHCDVHTGTAATGAALARSIAAQLASAVRDPDRDGTGLVRFASTADYLAAFLAALARGDAWQRWYFYPLRRLARLEPPAVFLALHAEGHEMPPVLLALKRSGELGRVLAAVGEEALTQAWPSSRPVRPRQQEWLSLVRLALDLARALGWDTTGHQDLRAVAAGLADRADADLDWTDPVGLAHALARAVRLVSIPADAREVSADQLPRWLDWADADALADSLSALPRPALPPGARTEAPAAAVRSPRTLALEAALSRLISERTGVLDPGSPTTGSIVLWAALTEQMPELAEAAWAREAVRRFVDRQVAAAPLARPAGQAEIPAGAARSPAVADVPCAGIYLLLRTLDAVRMPRLCRRAGVPDAPLLQALARRWAGPGTSREEVADSLRPIVGDLAQRHGSLTAGALQMLQAEVARIAVTQYPGANDVVRLRAVPFGATAMATILGDTDDLTWFGGQLRNSAGAAGTLPDWWREVAGRPSPRVEQLPGDADDPGRAILLADLAAVAYAHGGDPELDLPLDLIALAVLRHWARWLRGFSSASIPYLLSTFIRRPGRLIVDRGTLHVSLSRLPHDVVLDVSGYLAPFELRWPWPPLPGGEGNEGVRAAQAVWRLEFTAET